MRSLSTSASSRWCVDMMMVRSERTHTHQTICIIFVWIIRPFPKQQLLYNWNKSKRELCEYQEMYYMKILWFDVSEMHTLCLPVKLVYKAFVGVSKFGEGWKNNTEAMFWCLLAKLFWIFFIFLSHWVHVGLLNVTANTHTHTFATTDVQINNQKPDITKTKTQASCVAHIQIIRNTGAQTARDCRKFILK